MSTQVGIADVDGRNLFDSSGKWAGEQMVRAAAEGRPMNSQVLRTADVLRRNEWEYFDRELLEEGVIALHGVSDLISRGLVTNVPNSLGKTMYGYEKITTMGPAGVSLDGISRTDNDRQEFEFAGLPLPVIHKDFAINLRTLVASRTGGEGIDTTQIRTAGRVVSERAELMLFQGGGTFGGSPIYGYTTEPNRNTGTFGTGGNWAQAAKTGEQRLADVQTMLAALQADRYYGPYHLYVSRNASVPLDSDFKAALGITTRQRLLQVEGLQGITVVDQLPADNLVMVCMTSDVVKWIQGETLQTVQWDTYGGFRVQFKAWMIGAPLVRSDISGRSGIYHMS